VRRAEVLRCLGRDGILLEGVGRADSLVPLTPHEPPWPVRVKRWAVATIAAHLPDTSAALLAGLIRGEKTGLPRRYLPPTARIFIDEAYRFTRRQYPGKVFGLQRLLDSAASGLDGP
jgi:hypothetical protein